jgi:hypothetical protein
VGKAIIVEAEIMPGQPAFPGTRLPGQEARKLLLASA